MRQWNIREQQDVACAWDQSKDLADSTHLAVGQLLALEQDCQQLHLSETAAPCVRPLD